MHHCLLQDPGPLLAQRRGENCSTGLTGKYPVMKVTLKKLLQLIFLATLSVTTGLLVYLYHEPSIESIDEDIADSSFDSASFERIDIRTRGRLHYSNYISDHYHKFNSTVKDRGAFMKKPLEERCEEFFSHFVSQNPNFEYTRPVAGGFDKGVSKKKTFFDIEFDRMRIENKGQSVERTTELNFVVKDRYDKRVEETEQVTKSIAEMATLMRAYGKCFVNKKLNDKLKKIYDDMTKKLFPYLNDLLPQFDKVGNKSNLVSLDGLPVYNDDGDIVNTIPKPEKTNFMDYLLQNSNGKGIAIVASNRHGRDVIKLMRILRATNNRLPIQILYRNDMTDRVKNNIIASATAPKEFLLDPNKSGSYISVYPDLDLMTASKEFGAEFPPQKLTFVAYRETISQFYRNSFRGYYSKILGLLLTSFKEVILMDADSVPFIDMKEFFSLDDYKDSGALFFRDRALRDTNDFIETNFFANLFPLRKSDSLEQMLDIPVVTNKTMGNAYMTGYRHHQEAGIVILDRVKHFTSMLMMLPLALTGEPIVLSIWGEKEMYWIGFAMAGDEEYSFNKFAAAAVGSLSKKEHTYYPKDPGIHEVCLSHPGHIYKDGRLLWINSGFSYCKKNGSIRDAKRFPLNIIDDAEVVNMYSSPVKISHAVVPPDLPQLRHGGIEYKAEEEFISSWTYRSKDIDEVNNDETPRIEDEIPQKSWIKSPMCSGYYYCAYDQVAGYDNDGKRDNGNFFEFPKDKVKLYDFLGKIWMTGDARLV